MKVGDVVKVVGYESPATATLPYIGCVGSIAAIREQPKTWSVRVEFPDGRTELFAEKELMWIGEGE